MWQRALWALVVVGFLWADKPVDQQSPVPAIRISTRPEVHNLLLFTRKPTPRLAPGDTLAYWNFETGTQGWTATDGNNDGTTWTVGTNADLSTYTPPNYGTQYAYFSDDDAGNGAPAGEDLWASPTTNLSGVSSLYLNFGWGTRFISAAETLACYVVFNTSSSPDTQLVWVRTGEDGNGKGFESIQMTGYLPQNDIVIIFRYVDPVPGWWWAVSVDNVSLTKTPLSTLDEEITKVSHTATITSNTAWVDTVFLKNNGNEDNTFDLFYVIRDTLGNTVATHSITNFTHLYNPSDLDTFAVFTLSGLAEGFYTMDIYHNLANDNNNANDSVSTYVLALDNHNYNSTKQILVCDMDPALFNTSTPGGGYAGQSGVHLAMMLDNLGYVVDWMWGIIPSSFSPYKVVMITRGVHPGLIDWNLPSVLVTQMRSYLQSGGKAYAEGGDIWGWSSEWENGVDDQRPWDSLFGIASAVDGYNDLHTINGHPSTLVPGVNGKQWTNNGENSSMDQLFPLTTYNGILEVFLRNDAEDYNCGIAYHNTDYDYYTVATNFELAFADPATRGDPNLLEDIVRDGLQEEPVAVAETPSTEPPQAALQVTGLTQHSVGIRFTLPTAGRVTVNLYNLAGQRVRTLAKGTYGSGSHAIEANLGHLASGVYFVVLQTQNLSLSRHLVLIR